MVNVIQQAIEALEEAQNGLAWYRDRNPDQSDGSDDEAALRIEHAIHNLRAAQEGDLPPLPEPDYPAGTTGMLGESTYTADQIREYARTAIAAAGGGVPQGLKLIGYSCDEGGCGRIHDRQDGEYMTPVYVLASSPQPEAAPAVAQVPVFAGWLREWEGDVSDLGQWLFAATEDEKDESPNWRPVYWLAAAPEAPAQAAQWNPPPLTCPRSNRSDCALFGASIRVNSAKGSDHG